MKYNPKRPKPIIFSILFPIGLAFSALAQAQEIENEFLDMDLSQLMQVTITSVSKKPEPISNAAAAVFVITQEDIYHSGATSIPEVLRMAPGLQVAQFGANKWTVASRGFAGHFSNKLLVLIDGRTVYTPAFSGVYWDMQDTLLEDIARIEVIRGPGATLWGSNAMNGVINIITKDAQETQGGLVKIGVGTEDKYQGSLRYGGVLSKTTHGRGYLKYNKMNSFKLLRDNSDANDDWDSLQGGFRLDGKLNQKNSWTLQGDLYSNDENQLVSPSWQPTFPYFSENKDDFTAKGWNLLSRWRRKFSDTNSFSLQVYYDFTKREEVFLGQTQGIFDIDAQYHAQIGEVNNVTMGLGYRSIEADFNPTFQAQVFPEKRSDLIYSGFIQDAITLIPDELTLTLGTKWEHNDYTGHEFQPSGRLMWKPAPKHSLWTAVSRAVRTPSQIEGSSTIIFNMIPHLPPFPALITYSGNDSYDSEEMIAYEVGYRWFPTGNLSFDLALFHNDYDSLLTTKPSNPLIPYNFFFDNMATADSQGVELVVDWQPKDWLDLLFTYSYLHINADSSGSTLPDGVISTYEGSFPHHQVSLKVDMDISDTWNMNIWLRYVSEIRDASNVAETLDIVIGDYVDCDISLSYRPLDNLELTLVGQNLLQPERLEYISEFLTPPTEVERGVYATITWTFE